MNKKQIRRTALVFAISGIENLLSVGAIQNATENYPDMTDEDAAEIEEELHSIINKLEKQIETIDRQDKK